MSFIFDIQKITSYLNKYKEQLPDLYNWNPGLHRLVEMNVLTSSDVFGLDKLTPYQKQIKLRFLISNKLNECLNKNTHLFEKLCLWIIKDWGGIKGAKDDETLKYVMDFFSCPSPSFNRISSTSKVGSFLYPDKFIIYDARVAYSLNWIILSKDAGKFYFPIPDGRNSRMTALDLSVLIRLKNISNYQCVTNLTEKRFISNCDKSLFIPEKIAYTEFCKVINLVNNELWGDDKEKSEKLYYTEMLLFSIADRQIFQDITTSLTLNIASLN
jgi:hypothetical protein